MKQKDITILIVAVFCSLLVSFLAAKYLFGEKQSLSQQVEVVPTISPTFKQPNPNVFNTSGVDPTQNINIAPGNNNQVFQNNQGGG